MIMVWFLNDPFYSKRNLFIQLKVQKNILYTPGPLMTSETVKKAMLRDIGAGEHEFKQIVEHCRKILIDIASIFSNSIIN